MELLHADPSKRGHPVVYANPAYLKLSGQVYQKVIGQPWQCQLQNTVPAVAKQLQGALEGRAECLVQVAHQHSVSVVPVFDCGQLVNFIWMHTTMQTQAKPRDSRSPTSTDSNSDSAKDSRGADSIATNGDSTSSSMANGSRANGFSSIVDGTTEAPTANGNNMSADVAQLDMMRLCDKALASTTEGIVITDPNLPDNPVIYCNQGFERLTGYSQADILGRNCR